MSSGQLGAIPTGPPQNNHIITPGTKHQVQVFRDDSLPNNGKYYGRLSDGTNEPIGGQGFSIPMGVTTGPANSYEVSLAGRIKYEVEDAYVFQIRLNSTNTGASTLKVAEWGITKPLVDNKLNPILSGNMVSGAIYMITYNLDQDKFQVVGLDQLGV